MLVAIGLQIQSEITRQGITKYRVYKETGITEPTLTRLIKGHNCETKTLAAVCEFLGIDLTVRHK